jgi:hypothetical protein
MSLSHHVRVTRGRDPSEFAYGLGHDGTLIAVCVGCATESAWGIEDRVDLEALARKMVGPITSRWLSAEVARVACLLAAELGRR